MSESCIACGQDAAGRDYQVAEAMFRTGETFTYRECGSCATLRLVDVPDDLGRYYQGDAYYSLQPNPRLQHRWLRRWPVRQALRANTAIYLRTGRGRGISWAREAGIGTDHHILDIGTGEGENLTRLRLFGYRHLTGADPYVAPGKVIEGDIQVHDTFHHELDGQYDWVTMHHSFEHVPDPGAVLGSLQRLLAPGGRALVRMPVAGAAAWRSYGVDWVQIDAPRHLFVFTLDGFTRLATSEGFAVEKVFYDSTAFQFWGSELVAAGIPHSTGPAAFSQDEMLRWDAAAVELNLERDGDQVGIVLRRA